MVLIIGILNKKEKIMKYACPCCGYLTFDHPLDGTFDICPVCRWEDDLIQNENENYAGGANSVSLREARENYKKCGAVETYYVKFARKPLLSELGNNV